MGEQAISLRNVLPIQFQYKDTTTRCAPFFSQRIVRAAKILPLAYDFWLFWQLNANNWVRCWLSCNQKRFIVRTELYHVLHFICDHKCVRYFLLCMLFSSSSFFSRFFPLSIITHFHLFLHIYLFIHVLIKHGFHFKNMIWYILPFKFTFISIE